MSYRDDFDEKEAGLPEDVLDEVALDGDEEDDDKIADLPEEEEKEWEGGGRLFSTHAVLRSLSATAGAALTLGPTACARPQNSMHLERALKGVKIKECTRFFNTLGRSRRWRSPSISFPA